MQGRRRRQSDQGARDERGGNPEKGEDRGHLEAIAHQRGEAGAEETPMTTPTSVRTLRNLCAYRLEAEMATASDKFIVVGRA